LQGFGASAECLLCFVVVSGHVSLYLAGGAKSMNHT
jgi:hypothetical protein